MFSGMRSVNERHLNSSNAAKDLEIKEDVFNSSHFFAFFKTSPSHIGAFSMLHDRVLCLRNSAIASQQIETSCHWNGLLPRTVAMFSSGVRSDSLHLRCLSKRPLGRTRRVTTSDLYVPSERHVPTQTHHAMFIFLTVLEASAPRRKQDRL